MPTYEFNCTSCLHNFEKILKIDDRDLPLNSPCPQCAVVGKISREFTAPAVVRANRLEGHSRPPTPFREKMQQIKSKLPKRYKKNIKDY